ncbi:acyltransferase [Lentisphaera marina]|uniref:acyltransferase family protein n=1 Tax=Lentisphaera marina TaxID=1111041 RepID=UPI002365DBF5|nr:acyltransferase [Lentisphaera marina]MDD7986897.1 acyltransferase [Lentisphaera marina]
MLTKDKLPFLNSIHYLRGLAALIVVLEHAVGKSEFERFNYYFGWLDHLGIYGVVVFFLISGFVLPYSLYKADYQIKDFKTFFYRRLIRIEPTYIASIVFNCIIVMLITRLATNAPPWSPDTSQILLHLGYLIPFSNYEWIQGVYWTLAIEFQFYVLIGLLFPLITALKTNLASKLLLVNCFSILVLFSGIIPSLQILKYSGFFSLGLVVFILFIHQKSKQYNIISIFLSGLFYLILSKSVDVNFVAPLHSLLISSMFAALLILQWSPKIHNFNRFILFLGSISFSWYVTHQALTALMEPAARFIKNTLPQFNMIINFIPPLTIVFSIAVAYLFYKYVEIPSLKWSKKIKETR